MSLAPNLEEILQADIPESFKMFGKTLDAEWIECALNETGTATVRKRKLPAETLVWLVIGMALFRDRSIQEVVSHLDLVLPSQKKAPKKGSKTLAPSAIPQGRYRVGAAPLEAIFLRTAQKWANEAADTHRWRDLSLYGIDGTTLKIPDTDENREEFKLPSTNRGQSGYPQVRLAALMALRSHLISAVAFGAYSGKKTGEHSLAQQLWPKVPEQSLVIVDKGLIDYGVFFRLSHDEHGEVSGRKHWLTRGRKNTAWKHIAELGKGDELVELTIGTAARKKDPALPKKMIARIIHYQIKGHEPQILLTSLIDAQKYPAKEIVSLYHERWELELGYDEIKTHMLEREEALRSKKPEGVRQEIWGIMLAYNLVRKRMLDIAEQADVPPIRISFRHSLQLIRVFCLVEAWTCSPGNLPKRVNDFSEMLALLILPKRRPERRYERQVKIKMSGYKRNTGKPLAKKAESKKNSLN